MPNWRDSVLLGAGKASELHSELGIRSECAEGRSPIDVIGTINKLGLFLLFRPLDNLLGAYLPVNHSPGVLVTTKRDLHVQRFTAAHELGHFALGHRAASLDDQVGFVPRHEIGRRHGTEIEADSFASEFLMPRWLIVAILRRQRWGPSDLLVPATVYQLSLRLGVSYAATCWGLAANGFISREAAKTLASMHPKAAKQAALAGHAPTSWHADAWRISERDIGMDLLGSPEDTLVFELTEHLAGGYSWKTDELEKAGLTIAVDERLDVSTEGEFGAPTKRRWVLRGEGNIQLRIGERRQWAPAEEACSQLDLGLSLFGREGEGIPRALRPPTK